MYGKPEINYIVKPENGLVVCIIKSDDISCSGVARCHPDDVFDEKLGKEVARRKAIIRYKKLFLKDLREILENIQRRRKELNNEECYFLSKIRKMKESIGKMYTEIDNIVEFYSKS